MPDADDRPSQSSPVGRRRAQRCRCPPARPLSSPDAWPRPPRGGSALICGLRQCRYRAGPSMRRRHLQLLAHGARLVLLGVCGIAGGTAAVWTWQPDWVDAVDDACVRHFVTGYRDRLNAIAQLPDDRKARAYEALADDLSWVRRQDRLADVVEECYSRLSALAAAGNDLTAAVDWLARRVPSAAHDLLAASRLGALECRAPGMRDAGLARLQQLVATYPGHPTAVVALATAQADAERPADAAATL